MREIITIHAGQCGIQLGNACWELFCLEHGILMDGTVSKEKQTSLCQELPNSFFQDTMPGERTPRSVYIDTDSTTIDDVRQGAMRNLFDPSQLICSKQNPSEIVAQYADPDKCNLMDQATESIRKIVEKCEGFEGFLFFGSVSGNTGGGLGTNLLQRLAQDFKSKSQMAFTVFPTSDTNNQSSAQSLFNTVLATNRLLECANSVVILDNKTIGAMSVHNNLTASYSDINMLIAQLVSGMTASLRFEGCLFESLSDYEKLLVPFPKFRFLTTSQGPFVPLKDALLASPSIEQISESFCKLENSMAGMDPKEGKIMSCCLQYSGDLVPKDVGQKVILKLKKTLTWTDWTQTGFKCGIVYNQQRVLPDRGLIQPKRSGTFIANSTCVRKLLLDTCSDLNKNFSSKQTTNVFSANGVEESQLYQARDDLLSLEQEYRDAETSYPDQD